MCNDLASCNGEDTQITFTGLGITLTGEYVKDTIVDYATMEYERTATKTSSGSTIVNGFDWTIQPLTVNVYCSPESLAMFNAHKTQALACGDVIINSRCCVNGVLSGAILTVTPPSIVGNAEAQYFQFNFTMGVWQ